MNTRRLAKDISVRLGLYEHIVLARDMLAARAVLRRNERDGRHLTAILAATLRTDSNAIDVGAHYGSVLGEILRLAPDGHHLALEPIPGLAARLTETFPNVEVHAVAAAATAGTSSFQWLEQDPAYSGLRLRNDVGAVPTVIDVPMVRLDDLVHVPPRFVKIDVEGGEEGVLRGAQDTLARYRPTVAFEHGSVSAVYGTTSETIFSLLDEPGLRVFDMDGAGPLSCEQFVEVVGIGKHFNFLACPRT